MNFWKGYKTKIGMALVLIAQAGKTFAPDLAPWWNLIEQAGMIVGGYGIAAPLATKVIVKLKEGGE